MAEGLAQRRTRQGQALVGALVLLLALGGVGWWKQGWLLEQYHWRWKMGPSVLTAEQEREKAAKPGSDFKECATGCPTMIVVPAGRFIMGSPKNEIDRSEDEDPQHEVTIAKFAVSRTEVTFAQWDACFAAAACTKVSGGTWGRDDRPVINVSWDDAKQYVAWLSRITGNKDYRLLTEAEWEYAARAGSSARFTFGESEEQLDQYAWYSKNSEGKTQPVAKKKANAFGLHDMHGNVYEWVEDPWHDNYNGAPTDGSAWLQGEDDSRRVVRGGSWGSDPQALRAAFRDGISSGYRNGNIGFRLARTLNP